MIFVLLILGIYILVPKPHFFFLCLGLWKLRGERESHHKKERSERFWSAIFQSKRSILLSMSLSWKGEFHENCFVI